MISRGKRAGIDRTSEDTDRRNWRHTHERIRGNNGLTHGGQWRNSRNVIMVHGARKVVTAIMGNCPRRMVPQWRISLPLTTDCPNTSCSPRQDNERPLSGSGSLYSAVVVYQHRLDDGPLQSLSLSLSLSRLLPVFISFPRFWFTSSFFLFLFATPPPRVFSSREETQPLDKTSDLYGDYVDLRIFIAFQGDDRF